MTRAWSVAVATAVACFLGAACGGGSGNLTKAEYVRAADQVCVDAGTKVTREKTPDAGDDVEIAKASARVVTVMRGALVDLKALRPPARDRSQIAEWIALVDQTLDQADASAQAQRAGDLATAASANAHGLLLSRRADQVARGYGIRRCVTPAPPSH